MSRDQQAARVNVSDDEWIEFRTLAMRKRRSIADYLGELVRREVGGRRSQRSMHPPRSRSDLAGDPQPASASPTRNSSPVCPTCTGAAALGDLT